MSSARKSVPRDSETADTGGPNYQTGPDVKRMVLISNGDKLSRGRPYILNPTKVTTWPNLLQEFSEQLRPTFGAVRKVYTPRQGTEVTDFGQLQQDGVYVLSGTEKFKPLPNGYNTDIILNQHFNRGPKTSVGEAKRATEAAIPVYYSGVDMPDLRRASLQILTINVFRNGDDVNPPTKIMLKKFDLWNILRAKDAIAEKVKPTGGFCRSLRTLDGSAVNHVAEMKNGGYYVAVGPYEKFRLVDYSPEGRPNIVVPMKMRSSFTAQTYQDPDGQKRRRTFVVRLKKNDPNQADIGEDADDETETDEAQQDPDLVKRSRHSQKRSDSRESRGSWRSRTSRHPQDRTLARPEFADHEHEELDNDDDEPEIFDKEDHPVGAEATHSSHGLEDKASHHSMALDLPNSRLDVSISIKSQEHIGPPKHEEHETHQEEDQDHPEEDQPHPQDLHKPHEEHQKQEETPHDNTDHGPPGQGEHPPGEAQHVPEPPAGEVQHEGELQHDQQPGQGDSHDQPQPADGGEQPTSERPDDQNQEPLQEPLQAGEEVGNQLVSEGEEHHEANFDGQTREKVGDGQPAVEELPVVQEVHAVEHKDETGDHPADGQVTDVVQVHDPNLDGDHGEVREQPAEVSQKFDLTEQEEVVPTPKKKKGGCC